MSKSHIINLTITNHTGFPLTNDGDWFQTGRLADNNSWPPVIAPNQTVSIQCYESNASLLGCSGWVKYTLGGSPMYLCFSNPTAGSNGIDIGTDTNVWQGMAGQYTAINRVMQVGSPWVSATILSTSGDVNSASWDLKVCDLTTIQPANLEMRNVEAVFNNMQLMGNRRYYQCDVSPTGFTGLATSHFKGISSYAGKLIFTHSDLNDIPDAKNGKYLIADYIPNQSQGSVCGTFDTLHEGWQHPCSSQACGSFMAMGIQAREKGNSCSEIQILDIRMAQVNKPLVLLGTIPRPTDQVNGVAMTKESGPEGKYIVAALQDDNLTIYRSTTTSLITNGSPTVQFEDDSQAWKISKFAVSGAGIALITQQDGSIYLITLDADDPEIDPTKPGFGVQPPSSMLLFKLDVNARICTPKSQKLTMQMPGTSDSVTNMQIFLAAVSAGTIVLPPLAIGIVAAANALIAMGGPAILNNSFRWGKGLAITSPDSIEVYASDRNDLHYPTATKDFSLVTWAGVSHEPLPSGTTGFTGAYAVNNWTESTSAVVSTLWDVSRAPGAVVLKTSPTWMVSTDWMTINVPSAGVITFDWVCSSAAGDSHPCWSVVNGVRTQLNTGAASGSVSIAVKQGDSFAIMCQSNDAALTTLTLSNFQVLVPSRAMGFTGPYAAAKWTESTSAVVSTLWDVSGAPGAIVLKTSPVWRVSTDWMAITVPATGLITFDWVCSSAAGDSHPCWSVVAGVRTQLNTGAASGSASISVKQGDGFAIMCQSNDAALTTLKISNFQAPM